MLGLVLLQILVERGLVPPLAIGIPLYMIGMLAFAVTMSIFLARSFARTSLDLERQELQKRLLEAENARKTSEIEAARALRLSMLPAELPEATPGRGSLPLPEPARRRLAGGGQASGGTHQARPRPLDRAFQNLRG